MTQRRNKQPSTPEFDAQVNQFLHKFHHGWRTDPLSLAIRYGSILLTYALLARAIAVHELPAPLVLIPLLVEWLAILWAGPILARTLIPCPAFGTSSGSFGQPIGWTLAVGALLGLALAMDPTTGRSSVAFALAAAADAITVAIDAGVHWAVLALIAGLVAETAHETIEWKRRGGVFFWGATLGSAFRVVAAIFALPALITVLYVSDRDLMREQWIPDGVDLGHARSWIAFHACLGIELGALAIAHWVRRRIRARIASGDLPPGIVAPTDA